MKIILTSKQLRQYAPERPHVNRHPIPSTHHNLGRPVEPRLNVRIHALILVARAAKVYHLETIHTTVRNAQ